MSTLDIRVFHFQEGSADKIWAICTTKNQTSTYTVWFGRRNARLTCKEVPADQTPDSRMQEKLRKGYVELPNITIDPDSGEMMATHKSQPQEVIPDALWYRITPSRLFELQDRIDQIEATLEKESPADASVLRLLPLYDDIKHGKLSGSHEMGEGPLGVLLLFSLRRFGDGLVMPFEEGPPVSIADDFNNLLPDRFNDLSDYISDSCSCYLEKRGYISDIKNRYYSDEEILKCAQHIGVEHYTSVKAIKPLAIAMGCIDVPIDLAAIRPDQKSAFF